MKTSAGTVWISCTYVGNPPVICHAFNSVQHINLCLIFFYYLFKGFDADGNPINSKSLEELSADADELVGAVPSSRLARPSKAKKEKHGHEDEHIGHEHMEMMHEQIGHENMEMMHEYMGQENMRPGSQNMGFDNERMGETHQQMGEGYEHIGKMHEHIGPFGDQMDGSDQMGNTDKNMGPDHEHNRHEHMQRGEDEPQLNTNQKNNNEMQDHEEL